MPDVDPAHAVPVIAPALRVIAFCVDYPLIGGIVDIALAAGIAAIGRCTAHQPERIERVVGHACRLCA